LANRILAEGFIYSWLLSCIMVTGCYGPHLRTPATYATQGLVSAAFTMSIYVYAHNLAISSLFSYLFTHFLNFLLCSLIFLLLTYLHFQSSFLISLLINSFRSSIQSFSFSFSFRIKFLFSSAVPLLLSYIVFAYI
jgi:hypothetical protein